MERIYTNYGVWKRSIMHLCPDATIDGDKDIGTALDNGKAIGEWDGERGVIYNSKLATVLFHSGACARFVVYDYASKFPYTIKAGGHRVELMRGESVEYVERKELV